ncbi:hypothetical protein CapIbe_023842 [Capra ibex]
MKPSPTDPSLNQQNHSSSAAVSGLLEESFLLVRQDVHHLDKVLHIKDAVKEQVAGLSRRETNAQGSGRWKI